jgi:hypothetical protein
MKLPICLLFLSLLAGEFKEAAMFGTGAVFYGWLELSYIFDS